MKLPLKIIYLPWIIVILLSILPIYNYDLVSIELFFYLISFFLLSSFGFFLGKKKKNKINRKFLPNNKFIDFVILLSFLFIILKIYLSLTGGLGSIYDFSLMGLTEMRNKLNLFDAGSNSSILSIITSILAGFPILGYFILLYFKINNKYLSKNRTVLLVIKLFLSIITYLLGGGRNSLVLILLISFLSLLYFRRIDKGDSMKKNLKKYKKLLLLLLGIILFVIVGITISRNKYKANISTFDSSVYYSHGFGVDLNPNLYPYINSYNNNLSIVTTSLSLYYYITHPLHELNITLKSSPTNFPYNGNYQFYQFSMFLNKIGFDLISINTILNEIENPGKYTGLIGAMYLDFSYGSLMLFFILGFLFGQYWSLFIKTKSFKSFVGLVLISVVFLVSPIYSFISIGVFSSLIISLLITTFLF